MGRGTPAALAYENEQLARRISQLGQNACPALQGQARTTCLNQIVAEQARLNLQIANNNRAIESANRSACRAQSLYGAYASAGAAVATKAPVSGRVGASVGMAASNALAGASCVERAQ
jgi:hypothetical protein